MMGTFTFGGMTMHTTYAAVPTKTLVHEAGIAALLYHDDYPKQANLYKQAIGRNLTYPVTDSTDSQKTQACCRRFIRVPYTIFKHLH